MSFFIPQHTICKICNCPIETPKDSLVLDYINVVDHPDLRTFVKSFVHRSCYVDWNRGEEYSNAAFELITAAIERGDICHSVYSKSRLLILKFDEWISMKDFSAVFELEIPYREITLFCDRMSTLLDQGTDSLRFKQWQFEYLPEGNILVKVYTAEEISDKLTLSASRLREIVTAIRSVHI